MPSCACKVLIGGGAAHAEIFDPSLLRFSVVAGPDMDGRYFSTATLLSGGRVLLAGGYGENVEQQRSVALHAILELCGARTGRRLNRSISVVLVLGCSPGLLGDQLSRQGLPDHWFSPRPCDRKRDCPGGLLGTCPYSMVP